MRIQQNKDFNSKPLFRSVAHISLYGQGQKRRRTVGALLKTTSEWPYHRLTEGLMQLGTKI